MVNSYNFEEIEFFIDELKISGTLTLPKKKQNPCVILLNGYGSETRDLPVRNFKRYEFLANLLAKHGIASLRYDDRGSGKSSKVDWHDYTFEDLTTEVLEAQSFLKEHSFIDSKKIGLFGHSLGAIIAPLAASKNDDFSFVISAAPHGLIGLETAIQTRNAIAKLSGETREEITLQEKFIRNILKDLQEEKTSKDAIVKLKQNMLKRYQDTIKQEEREEVSFESFLQSTFEGFLLAYGDKPMYRSFLKFNPQNMYQKINCPILLLFADNDLIHPSEIHRKAIDLAFSKTETSITIHNFPDANHDFTKTKNKKITGFIDNFCKRITCWISNQFNY
ncbi:MAG: alpha/beta hydrolase [Asgard group archaeon]|nr:alpha/beta hydrolase [Asgard group archaeon]